MVYYNTTKKGSVRVSGSKIQAAIADLAGLEVLLVKLGRALSRPRIQLVRLLGQLLGYVVEDLLHVGALFRRRLDEMHVVAFGKRLAYMKRYFAAFCQIALVTFISFQTSLLSNI